jgi:hypothetical protein
MRYLVRTYNWILIWRCMWQPGGINKQMSVDREVSRTQEQEPEVPWEKRSSPARQQEPWPHPQGHPGLLSFASAKFPLKSHYPFFAHTSVCVPLPPSLPASQITALPWVTSVAGGLSPFQSRGNEKLKWIRNDKGQAERCGTDARQRKSTSSWAWEQAGG